MQDADDLKTLMPNTIAVTEKSTIHSSNLKQYMEVSNNEKSTNDSKQNEARAVWKDHQGFEDVDEFWIEDDSAVSAADGATEDEDNDDSSIDLNLSISSESSTSEREATVPGESTTFGFEDEPPEDEQPEDEQPEFDFDGASIHDNTDDMEVDNIFVEKKLSTTRSREPTSPKSGFDQEISKSTKQKSKKKNKERKNTFSLSPIIPRGEKENNETPKQLKKNRKRKNIQNESSDYPKDGFDLMSSPFTVDDGALTPVSNASDRSLKHIRSFEDEHEAPLSKGKSPTLKKKLFDSVKKDKNQRYLYYNEDATNHSASFNEDEMTDKDASFQTISSATESEGDQSANEDDLEKSTQLNAPEKELSFAEEVIADGLRRSKRRRYKPLAWYKGEHYVYERTRTGVGLVIPTVVGVARAGVQTPEKSRVKPRKVTTSHATRKNKLGRSMAKMPANKLPDDRVYEHGEWAELYDSMIGIVNKINVICRQNQVEFRTIPNSNQNEEDEKRLGYAAQTFNLGCFIPFSRWIAGQLGLPPLAEKDIESGGDKISVFFVMDCQPQSLEVSMAPLLNLGTDNDDDDDEGMDIWDSKRVVRFLLSAGDEFYVPPGNAYYLKNHSERATADLRFMLLKPESNLTRNADLNTTALNSTKEIDETQQHMLNETKKVEDPSELHADRTKAQEYHEETHVNKDNSQNDVVETHVTKAEPQVNLQDTEIHHEEDQT